MDVQLKDFNGKQISVNDIDLELHLSPEQLMSAQRQNSNDNRKHRVKQILSRLTRNDCQKTKHLKNTKYSSNKTTGESNVVYIKDKVTLKDSINGTEFDVEMDLKVEIENPDKICRVTETDEKSINRVSESDSDEQEMQKSTSCGRVVRHAFTDRLCRSLFGGSASRLDPNSFTKTDRNRTNNNICAASCISAPWKRRLARRQLKEMQHKKEVLARSKSLELPRQKEQEKHSGMQMINLYFCILV